MLLPDASPLACSPGVARWLSCGQTQRWPGSAPWATSTPSELSGCGCPQVWRSRPTDRPLAAAAAAVPLAAAAPPRGPLAGRCWAGAARCARFGRRRSWPACHLRVQLGGRATERCHPRCWHGQPAASAHEVPATCTHITKPIAPESSSLGFDPQALTHLQATRRSATPGRCGPPGTGPPPGCPLLLRSLLLHDGLRALPE